MPPKKKPKRWTAMDELAARGPLCSENGVILRAKPGVELYRDSRREWRWRLRAKNGKILADSGEGYKRRPACFAGWRAVVRAARA